MKKTVIAVILVLLLATPSCSISNIEMKTIDEQTVTLNEPLPSNLGATKLVFNMTGGEFNINPGSGLLVSGSIIYNVEQWEPQFTRSNNDYEIKQISPFSFSGIPTKDVINTWDLTLTNEIPLTLTIEGGASQNNFDFTGLQLTDLKITQGASETTVRFDAPNPMLMENFSFTTGASSADLYGLGYANFSSMTFSAGAGDYTLDFTGALTRETTVNIKSTISNIRIVIPAGMKAVIVNKGTVSNINTEGTWMLNDDTYNTLVEGYTLTINLEMAVGNVTLVHEN